MCDDFEDEIVNNKAFEHAGLIFTEPWRWRMKSC